MTGLLTKDDLGVLEQVLPKSNGDAGVRIFGNSQLNDWLCSGPVSGAVRSRMPGAAAVRAILFDKSADRNWSLGWHQDRMIALRQRTVAPGFDHWTVKNDILHVEPPIGILEGMITMRIHLDPVGEDNAPLLVAPGSHQFGRIRERDIDAVVQRCGRLSCLADSGDVWLYRTAILHASERSRVVQSRRVLQVDFSDVRLPVPLEWLGIA